MNVFGLHLPVLWQTVTLLALSNIFMTFAWYSHLKHLNEKPWWIAALISWGIALFEYSLHTQVHRQWTNCLLRKINEMAFTCCPSDFANKWTKPGSFVHFLNAHRFQA